MLLFFPKPYPDETFYSVISRYHKYSGNLHMTHTLNDLFGVSNISINPDFASEIDKLLKGIPGDHLSPEEILYNHTLLPYYAAFIPKDRVENAKEIMIHKTSEKNPLTKLGINNSAVINYQYFNHCTECIKEDEDEYGETYWHRIHQVPGVYVCPKHKRPLIRYNKQYYEFNVKGFLIASSDLINQSTEYQIENRHIEIMTDLAKESQWLLNNKIEMPASNYYSDQYIAFLQNLQIATVNRTVKRKSLFKKFKEQYDNELLKKLQSEVTENNGKSWVEEIFRNHHFLFHPIRHILVIKMLSKNLEEFFATQHTYQPFGKGPWPCLNAAHNHYGKFTITDVEIKRSSSKQPTGTFACECGFVYSRRGPDKDSTDLYKRGRIVEFGQVWYNKLRKLMAKQVSTAEIARTLDVAPSTIRRKRNNIHNRQNNSDTRVDNISEKTNYMRKEWIKLTKKHTNITESQLSRLDRRLHYWLYHNDYIWLKNNQPETNSVKALGRNLNWIQRDEKLYNEVNKVIKNWEQYESNDLKKVTKNSIAKKTERPYMIFQYSHKIPKTMQLIDSVAESKDEYHHRKLSWALGILQNEGTPIKLSALIKKSGLNPESISSNTVEYAQNQIFQ